MPTGRAPSLKFDSPRGLLDSASGKKRFRLARYHPSAELGFFVEHYWTVEWARLAIDLGYFDQAHFIKDFKRFAGRTPHEYARGLGNRKPD